MLPCITVRQKNIASFKKENVTIHGAVSLFYKKARQPYNENWVSFGYHPTIKTSVLFGIIAKACPKGHEA